MHDPLVAGVGNEQMAIIVHEYALRVIQASFIGEFRNKLMVRIQLDDAVIPRVGNIDIVLIIDEDILRLFEGASLCAEVGHHVTDLIGERRGQLIALGIDDVVG